MGLPSTFFSYCLCQGYMAVVNDVDLQNARKCRLGKMLLLCEKGTKWKVLLNGVYTKLNDSLLQNLTNKYVHL